MFRTLLLTAMVLLGFAAHSPADEPAPPSGAAPSFMFVSEVDVETEELTSIYTVLVPVQEAITVAVVDPATGKTVEEVRTVTKYVPEQRARLLSLKGFQVVTPSGKVVPTDQALKRMAGRVVLDASRGVDPAYLKLFKDDVLVVVPRAEKEAPKERE